MKTPITIRDLVVKYGPAPAVDGVNLSIAAGELFLLVGPSGCGKTTLLRAIAGFVNADAGSIWFGDEDVTSRPAHTRKAGMLFQSFALWPHMNVFENVAFGLREARVPRREIAGRVEEALESTQIPGYGGRRIEDLSGGEQQRVALARALVVRPRCLLLDEPLSNLDAKLRRSMREEIRRICKSFGLTTIYVTHDQKEALAVADRIAVMHAGKILQVGTPEDVYRRPRSRAVAAFIGDTNLVKARVSAADSVAIRLESGLGILTAAPPEKFSPGVGDDVWLSIRPECVRPSEHRSTVNALSGRVMAAIYLGELAELQLTIGEQPLSMYEINPSLGAGSFGAAAVGEDVVVQIAPADILLLPFDDLGLAASENP